MEHIKDSINFVLSSHRGEPIIKLKFKKRYDALLIEEIKKHVSIRYSNSNKVWYVQDNDTNRAVFELNDRVSTTRKIVLEKKQSSKNHVHLYICLANQLAVDALQNEILLNGMSPLTLKTYVNEFKQLLYLLGNVEVNTLNYDKIKSYLLLCVEKLGIKESQMNQRINAIKFYFEHVLKKGRMLFELPRPQKPILLPKVLSEKEIVRIFLKIENLKHRCMIMLAYSGGLRVSEIVTLKVKDIDSDRMQIRVEQAKGKKDRVVMLSTRILEALREYYKMYKPAIFLFEGQYTGTHISKRTAQIVFKRALVKAKVNKDVSFHSLRHSFATHLLEHGTDIRIIQELLGHSSVETTMQYTHVSMRSINKVMSPLDKI